MQLEQVTRKFFRKNGCPRKKYCYLGLPVLDSDLLTDDEFFALLDELKFIDPIIYWDEDIITLKRVFPSDADHKYFSGKELLIGNINTNRFEILILKYNVGRFSGIDKILKVKKDNFNLDKLSPDVINLLKAYNNIDTLLSNIVLNKHK